MFLWIPPSHLGLRKSIFIFPISKTVNLVLLLLKQIVGGGGGKGARGRGLHFSMSIFYSIVFCAVCFIFVCLSVLH